MILMFLGLLIVVTMGWRFLIFWKFRRGIILLTLLCLHQLELMS